MMKLQVRRCCNLQSNADKSQALRRKRLKINNYMVYAVFALTLLFFAVWLGGTFFSVTNILNITRQTAMVSVMAVAMVFVIASGNIDLSVGSTVALTSLVVALVLQNTGNILLAVATGVLIGALIGLVNGLLITKVGIPSFLATLGVGGVVKGTAMWVTNTAAVPITNPTFNNIFGLGTILGIPTLFLWTIGVMLVGHYALNYMGFGKKVLAVGGNSVSAKYTGIKIDRITTNVMILSSVSAVLAGLLYSGRMQAARYTFGEGDELNVIAAVILGGTSMAGGKGSVIGAVVGSLLMGTINNGLIIGGLSVSQQVIVRGAIIVLAVGIGTITNRYAKSN